jgi:glucose-6-phosphate isomerase
MKDFILTLLRVIVQPARHLSDSHAYKYRNFMIILKILNNASVVTPLKIGYSNCTKRNGRMWMKTNITEIPEWKALETHHQQIAAIHMQDWFNADPKRFSNLSLSFNEIFLDYSKNRITAETRALLIQLAEGIQLRAKIEDLFTGKSVNFTEGRAALHTALRDRSNTPLPVNGHDIKPDIFNALRQMGGFIHQVHSGTWLGCTGKPVRDIINIGIGGSHLGPLLGVHALSDFAKSNLRCHFISNIDTVHVNEVLKQINPETSLFIISSKSFTTLETITNATTLKNWLQAKIPGKNINKHFVAVTAAHAKAKEFGIADELIFPVWEWIGGRYSIWSSIGLPLALLIGEENFLDFLSGAYEMDEHFRHTDFEFNMPVIMALLGIWYINFFAANNHAIVPYSHQLTHLRTYLQQADMESNGKNISRAGVTLPYATGPIIWGEQGCNAQHAFHQLLHQGQHFIPVDFILVAKSENDFARHHDILVSSGLSQAQALLYGKSYEAALQELIHEGIDAVTAKVLARHKTIPGNKPSNLLFVNRITPHNLGALLALYEHKIFVQGAIWDINSFDQWGVELGKQLLPQILADLTSANESQPHDSSTQGLINHYKKVKA